MIDGEVDAIDFEKSRKMATYQGNSSVKVMMPSGKTKQISFLCEVFGYRKLQREFDPAVPAEDLYLDDKGNLVVPFELARLQKGDIAIMYNVFFFKDAAVMRPESRYEVNNLLELLVENPTYRIRIHGHTNGNASGKIIRMNKEGNYYSLSETKQGFGSAKELSEERAIVMRDFLVNSGISAERMEVKAWGGRKPIHDKNSVRANENVRVEIEILSQ
jgi:outer membrane protein OmpA-like peptidoglycan-associated protein